MSEKYKTVVHYAREAKQDVLCYALEDIASAEGRYAMIERWCLRSAGKHLDESARDLFSLALRAVDDLVFFPLFQAEGHECVLPDSPEVRDAKGHAAAFRVQKAMLIWKALPKCRVEEQMDYGKMHNVEKPTLPKTREVILTEIATRWRETDDEAEADVLFEFLYAAYGATVFLEEQDAICGIVRSQTNMRFSVNRLTRHIAWADEQTKTQGYHYSGFRQVLAIGRTRLMGESDVAISEMRVIAKTTGFSPAAFEFLSKTAAELATVDAHGRSLLQVLQPRDRWGHLEHGNAVTQVEISLSYQPGMFHCWKLDLRRDWKWHPDDDIQCNSDFEKVRAVVVAWAWQSDQRRQYQIELAYVAVDPNSVPRNAQVFFRKENLASKRN